MDGPIDTERKACKLIIYVHERDLCVTMVGRVDVPDSDRGDFRRRRAFDISCYFRWCTCFVLMMALINRIRFYSTTSTGSEPWSAPRFCKISLAILNNVFQSTKSNIRYYFGRPSWIKSVYIDRFSPKCFIWILGYEFKGISFSNRSFTPL